MAKPGLGTPLNGTDPLVTGLVGCWVFNEGSGTSVADLASGNAGSFVNSPTWDAAPGSASDAPAIKMVTSADSYINVGDVAALRITTDITIVTRYRINVQANWASNRAMLVTKDKDTGGRAYTLDLNDATGPNWYIDGGSPTENLIRELRDPVDGDDRQVAASYRTSDKLLALYVDGSLVASGTASTSGIPSATAQVQLGRREYSGFTQALDGWIYYVYIWNRKLTDGEISGLATNPYSFLGSADANLVWMV